MMRSPQQFWEATCEDTRWLDAQAAVLEDAMREAFAAGYAEGAQLAARSLDGHAKSLGQNLAMRLPESVTRGVCALAVHVIETGADPVVVEAAWKRCVRAAGTSAADAAAKAAG
jgi:hypothetical protein